MPDTRIFREQHRRILTKARELSQLMAVDKLADDAMSARLAVAELAGLINVHLAMEDQGLYPILLENSDPKVRAEAEKYIAEMGSIGGEFKEYMQTWAYTNAAEDDPKSFIKETQGILDKLSNRIYREDNELYVLVESLNQGD